MPEESVLIIGAGQAGAQTAASLRQGGFNGAITLIGDEPTLPYQRPPLSKAFLKGDMTETQLYLKPDEWYKAQNINIQTNTKVLSIDTVRNTAKTQSGEAIKFDNLVFATGSRNRQLALEGATSKNVFGLRGIRDVTLIRPHVGPGKNLVIIGAGYIGLETAAVANDLGTNVVVLELADRVLARVTSTLISEFYENLHRENEVDIRTNTQVSKINEKNGIVKSITLETGETLPCDSLLIGIGILPNTELAADAGILCNDGILVDANARTNIPHVYAVGDCAKRNITPFDRMGRLESVHNAIEQGKQAAAGILGTLQKSPDCPWFWSDQYNIKLQIAGLSTDYDNFVVRGSITDKKFAVFYFKNSELIAVDAINSAPEFMTAKKLILAKAAVPSELLSDETQSLKEITTRYL